MLSKLGGRQSKIFVFILKYFEEASQGYVGGREAFVAQRFVSLISREVLPMNFVRFERVIKQEASIIDVASTLETLPFL